MRIAFLCKRKYMGKDVILDRYARLYEIPFQLARLGHTVRGYCLSYQGHDQGEWGHEAASGSLHWESRSLGSLKLPILAVYPRRLLKQLRDFRPDIVIGASDIPHVILGAWLARKLRVPYVADLYDNFESFGQARIPGMVAALRRAVRSADLVTTTSQPLADYVTETYRALGEVVSMPSTIDKSVFHPRDRDACRETLGLPCDATLIGTAGGLNREKGVQCLYAAWELIRERDPSARLVLAGPHEAGLPPPGGERVHYLGALPHDRVPQLFCALDVGVICILDTPFGRYCFPQKAYEMLACGLTVVAADVGAMGGLLAGSPECLFRADDARDLADKLLAQAAKPSRIEVDIDDWTTIIGQLEARLSAHAAR